MNPTGTRIVAAAAVTIVVILVAAFFYNQPRNLQGCIPASTRAGMGDDAAAEVTSACRETIASERPTAAGALGGAPSLKESTRPDRPRSNDGLPVFKLFVRETFAILTPVLVAFLLVVRAVSEIRDKRVFLLPATVAFFAALVLSGVLAASSQLGGSSVTRAPLEDGVVWLGVLFGGIAGGVAHLFGGNEEQSPRASLASFGIAVFYLATGKGSRFIEDSAPSQRKTPGKTKAESKVLGEGRACEDPRDAAASALSQRRKPTK